MEKIPAFVLLFIIIGGLIYTYLSIYFNTKSYFKKVKKYKKLSSLKRKLKNK